MSRLLLVDDNARFRRLAARLLTAEGFDVVGQAPDGLTAVTAAAALQPDLVLLDVQLPDIDGFEVVRRMAELADPPPIILVSSRAASEYGSRVAASGVLGFVRKEELCGSAIRSLVAPVA